VLFIGLSTTAIGYFEMQTYQQYVDEGVRAEAVITDKKKEYDGEEGWSYWFEYRFVTETARTAEGWDFVGEEEFNTTETGTPVQIVYLSTQPEVNTYASYLATKSHIYMLAFGGIFLAVGLGLILVARFR
jgi:hypothetical protein